MDPTPTDSPGFSSPAPLPTAEVLLEALPWGVLVLDGSDVIRRINPQAAQWCGAPVGELLGQPLSQAPLPPALSAALRQLREPGAAQLKVWLPPTQQWLSLRAAPAPAGQHWVFLENVTARHQAEEARQRSSQLLLDMEAVARTGSYEADLASGSFYFSDGMYRLFGEAPQAFEVTLAVIDARSHPADAAAVQQVLNQAIRTRQPYTYRRRIRRADGEWRTLEAHGEVRCDAAGRAVQLRGLVQDVTERVQAEQQLHESHELLQRTIDSSLDLVQVFEAVRDERGAVVDFTWELNNEAAERVYGEVIGQRLCERNPGVVAEGIFDTFRQVLETGVPDQRERHYVHEQFDGWFYQSTVKLGDGVTTTTHDITARKRMEQALRESRTLLQDIIDAPNIGLAVYRAVRDEAGTIVDFVHEYINRASNEMLGEDFTGRLFTDHGDNGRRQLAQLREVLELGRRNNYLRETDFRGRRVWFAITNTPLDGDRLVHTWEDVTERQRVKAEIIRLKDELAQHATDKYHALLDATTQGFCLLQLLFDEVGQAVDFRYLETNPAFMEHSGLPANALGKTVRELVPDLEPLWLETYGRVALTGQPERLEYHVAQLGRWYDAHAFRMGPPEAQQVGVLFSDITARKQAGQRQQFLLQLADVLGPLADPLLIATTACQLLVEHLAASRAQYTLVEGELDAEIETVYGEYLRRGRAMPRRFPLAPFGEAAVALLRAGQTFVLTDSAQDARLMPEQRALFLAVDSPAAICVPLVKEGRFVATLTVHDTVPRQWMAAEIILLEEVAERTWAAVERARVEEALRTSEEQFRAVANLVPDLLWRSSPDGETTWYNQRWCEYTGQTLEEAAGYGWADVIHPEDRAESGRRYRSAVTAGQPLRQEHRIRSAEGEYRWFQVQARPLRNEHGEVTAWFGAATDIHARKLVELRLRRDAEADAFRIRLNNALRPLTDAAEIQGEPARLLREWLDAGWCYYCEVDETGTQATVLCDAARPGLLSLAGVHDLSAAPDYTAYLRAGNVLNAPDIRTAGLFSQPAIERYVALGMYAALGVPLVKDGQLRAMLVVADTVPRTWPPEAIPLLQEVAARIWVAVERARAEAALRTSERRLRLLTDAMPALISYIDAGLHYRFTNQYHQNWFGCDPQEIQGQHLRSFLGEAAFARLLPRAEAALAGQRQSFEEEVPFRKGGTRYVRSELMPEVRPDGSVAGYYSLVVDITERKRREQNTALLADLSNDLSVLTAPDDIMHTVGERLGVFLGAAACIFADVDEARNEATIYHGWNVEGVASLKQTFRLADYFGEEFRRAGQAGRPSIVDDTGHDPLANAEAYAALGIGAFVTVPFQRQGHWVANMTVTSRAARPWRPDEIGLLQEVAARVFPRIDRARAELALQLSEQRLQALIANLPGAAAFVVGPDLRYQLAGGEALSAAGFAPSDLLGRTIAETMPPELVPEHEAHYRQALAGQDFSLEHTAHGRTFVSRGVPLLDAIGQPEAVLVVSYDITARKQAEEALLVSETKYRMLFESMDQGFGIGQVLPADEVAGTPLDWQWLEVNPQFERLTGLPRAAVLSQTTRQLIPGLEEIWYERYAQAAAGETVNFESYSPVLGRWFDVYAFGLGALDNRRVAVLFSNTSEQKQVEAALREAEARYREQLEQQVVERTRQLQESRDLLQSVFDTSLISMSVLRAVRDEAGQVQDFRLALVNKELIRETGRTDLVGKLYAQEYPGIRQVGIFDLMLRALATGEPQGMDYFYDYEGFNRWFTCQFVRLGDSLIATNLDITERKVAEQERLKNLRLLEQAEAVAGLGSWDYNMTTGHMRWSDGMYHLFGLPVGSPVEPSHYLAAVVDDDRPRAEQLVHQLTAGKGFEATLRLRVHEQIKTVRMKAIVLRDETGQPMRILGVDVDISELQRLEADNLHLRLGQQQALFEAVQAAQEAERQRMAESLHNGIGQILYATKLRLDLLRPPLLASVAAQEAARQEADQLLGEAIRQTRALSHELVPMMLEEFGLAAALQDIGQKMSTTRLHLRTHAVLDEEAAPLTRALQMALYRMAQELAQNIVKHAHGATEASLELETTPGWVLLRAEDNGPGFAVPPVSAHGLGLRSIRDQVALLGGQVESGSRMAGGAYVRIRLPLPAASA